VTLIRSCLAVVEFNELVPCLPPALNAIMVSVGAMNDVDGVIETLELVSGFATRYKAEIAPLLAIPGLVEAVVDLSLQAARGPELGGDGPEVENDEFVRDSKRVRKTLSYFLFWVTNCGLTQGC
jgi:hypothetical protein